MTDLIYMTLSASAAIILVCIVRKLFGSRLPKSSFPVLWGIIILRMLIPFSVRINLPAVTDITFTEGTCISADTYEVPAAITPEDIIRTVYIIGIIASLGITTASHLKNRAVYSCALPCTDEKILAAAEKFRLRRKVRIKVSDRVISPFTYGIARPVIVLPAKGIDSENIDAVLSHEMNHIRSFDVLLKKLALLAACIHWFNPLAWVMLVLTDRDIELACDEAVILSGCFQKKLCLRSAEHGGKGRTSLCRRIQHWKKCLFKAHYGNNPNERNGKSFAGVRSAAGYDRFGGVHYCGGNALCGIYHRRHGCGIRI